MCCFKQSKMAFKHWGQKKKRKKKNPWWLHSDMNILNTPEWPPRNGKDCTLYYTCLQSSCKASLPATIFVRWISLNTLNISLCSCLHSFWSVAVVLIVAPLIGEVLFGGLGFCFLGFFIPLASFRTFSLISYSLKSTCEDIYIYILLSILWASWVCGLVCDTDWGELPVITASERSSIPSSLLLLVFPSHVCHTFCCCSTVLG